MPVGRSSDLHHLVRMILSDIRFRVAAHINHVSAVDNEVECELFKVLVDNPTRSSDFLSRVSG